MKQKRGFTLVELLIVISLIAILSVAVLATINPIEQANKAKDSTVQNDAAEVLNSYERYYANAQAYPWMAYDQDGTPMTVDDAVILEANNLGFGICDKGDTDDLPTADSAACSASSATPGLLIESDELKPSFVGKAEFSTVGVNPENGLWAFKASSAGGSIYVCYIPKAKSNRQQTTKLYCLDDTNTTMCKVGERCTGEVADCAALAVTADTWDTPATDGVTGMFRCVPE